MTLTFRDKIILLILLFVVCCFAGYKTLWVSNSEKISLLELNKHANENLYGDLKPIQEEKSKLEKEEKEARDSVNNIKSLSGGYTATNEEFLVFLGDSAKENNVIVSGFNDLGTESKGGIYRSVFDFELKGNSVDINNVLEDINNIGIKCSFGSISYRQNEGYDYLKRFFDDLSELPWFEEKEEEEKPDKTNEKEEQKEQSQPTEKPPVISEDKKIHVNPPSPIPDISTEPINPPNADKKPKTIEERLDELLKQTSVGYKQPYKVVLLTDDKYRKTEYKEGQQMKLNVTVCLIMYNEPSIENSFLNKTESDSDAIL